MAKVFGSPKIFSGVVSLMKADLKFLKQLQDERKYPIQAFRKFLFHNSYLINHRFCDLKKSNTEVPIFYPPTQTLFGSDF